MRRTIWFVLLSMDTFLVKCLNLFMEWSCWQISYAYTNRACIFKHMWYTPVVRGRAILFLRMNLLADLSLEWELWFWWRQRLQDTWSRRMSSFLVLLGHLKLYWFWHRHNFSWKESLVASLTIKEDWLHGVLYLYIASTIPILVWPLGLRILLLGTFLFIIICALE